jgi:biotin carboxyl carrier protein
MPARESLMPDRWRATCIRVRGSAARAWERLALPRASSARPALDTQPEEERLASRSPSAASLSSTRVRSFEGYVLPHLTDVTAGTAGVVSSILVSPHEVVQPGQTVAVLERLSSCGGEDRSRVAVKAPAAGLVTRCWATTGELVGANWPILSIARSEDVMVVARFPPGHSARICRGCAATVLLAGEEREAFPASILTVIEAPDADAPDARSARVVLSFPAPPAKALWPGTPARVEIVLERGRVAAV